MSADGQTTGILAACLQGHGDGMLAHAGQGHLHRPSLVGASEEYRRPGYGS